MENKKLKSFKDLTVWQKAADLSVLIYETTEDFPKEEIYGITSQMRRASVSISSNIAEGFKRNHKKEKLQFYNIAYGSAAELESQIEIANKLNFLSLENYRNLLLLLTEISKMTDGLIKSLNSKSYILKPNDGVASLPIIMGLTLLILAVGVSITALGFTESFIVAGQKQSSEALFYAEAGARDALMKIIRNKNYSELSGYQIAFVSDGCTSNDGCAIITVSSGDGSALDPKIINSEGRGKNNIRKIRVEVIFDDSLNGEIKNANWQEVID